MSIMHEIINGSWEVRRTIWPYKHGYGTYHPRTRTLLDSGLSKEEAERRCKILNTPESKSKPD